MHQQRIKLMIWKATCRPHEKLECVFSTFPKYHTKVFLGDFNGKLGRREILKPKIKNENLHEINNVNGVRLANSAISKNHNET
jgi:hypothetical protein